MKLIVLVLDADWSVQHSSCTKIHDIFTPTVQHETIYCVSLYAALRMETVSVYFLIQWKDYTSCMFKENLHL